MAAYAPQADEPELIAAHAVPVDQVQRQLLCAGCILVSGGWLVLIDTISNRAATPNAVHALLGLALLLLGVLLITLSPVANQFGAAVADTVIFYFLPAPN